MKFRFELLLLPVFLIVFLLLVRGSVPASPYAYDEADYMYVASLGLRANYTDSPTLPLGEFLRLGLTQGRQARQRTSLSERIRNSNDVVFYRHWHGPLYYYWLIAASQFWKDHPPVVRALSWTFHILTFLVVFFGSRRVLPGFEGRWTAVMCGLLYFWSFANIRTACDIAPHALFVLCYSTCLLLVAKMRETGGRRYWYGAVLAAGFAFCTLEVSIVLIATLVICGWLERARLGIGWAWRDWARFAGKSLALFLSVVLLVWPMALWKLSFVKAYFFMGYLALFRKSPWGNVTFADTWRLRLLGSPVEWALFALSLVLFFRFRRQWKGTRAAAVFLIFATLMLLAVLRVNTDTPRYMSPFFPALHWFAGFMLAAAIVHLRPITRYAVAALLGILLLGNAARQFHAHPMPTVSRDAVLIEYVRAHQLDGKRLLVWWESVPLLHYYFPGTKWKGYLDPAEVAAELGTGDYDGVLYSTDQIRYDAISKP